MQKQGINPRLLIRILHRLNELFEVGALRRDKHMHLAALVFGNPRLLQDLD